MTRSGQSPLINHHRRLWAIAITAIAAAQFCLFLNHRDVTSAHEGRVVATAREMLARHDWIVPYCNDVPRIAKPPLAYWTTMIAWSAAREQAPWLARLPAAICGALAVLLMMELGRRVLGRDGGVVCGLVWISTWFIVDEYRKSMADPYLAFFTLLSVWAWIAARERRSSSLLLLAYVSAGFGALAKGHLILLHLALALIPYHLAQPRRACHLSGRPTTTSRAIVHVVGVTLMLAIALAWPLYIYLHVPDAASHWRSEMIADRTTGGAKTGEIYHYLINLPVTSAPWTVFGIVGAVMAITGKRRRERRALWPLCWLVATVVLFSLVPMKKNAYLLPAMPAQTLLIGAALTGCIRTRRANETAASDRFLLVAHLVAAIITLATIVYLVVGLDSFEIEPPAPLLAGAAVGLFLLLGIRKLSPQARSLRTIVVTSLLFVLAILGVESWLVPDFDNRRSDAPFALETRTSSEGADMILIGPGPREDVLFYLGRPVKQIASIDALPADYRGVAIVTADQIDATRHANRGDELTVSNDRAPKDKLYLFRFPKAPPSQQGERPR